MKIFSGIGVKKRLDLIIRELGLSGRAFERECGLTNGSYASIGDGVGVDKLNKILFRYPQLSAEWIVSGTGKMFKNYEDTIIADDPGINFEDIAFGNVNDQPNNQQPTNQYIHPLSPTDMKIILNQMVSIVSHQQQEISRLISELEQNGKRSDRILNLMEQKLVNENLPTGGQNFKSQSYSNDIPSAAKC